MSKNGNHKGLDELSWNILKELQANARMSTTEIGRRIGLSAPAVAERIAKMEERESSKAITQQWILTSWD